MSCNNLDTAYKDNIPGLLWVAQTGFHGLETMDNDDPEIEMCIFKGGIKDQETVVSFSVSQYLLDSLNFANFTDYLLLPADCYEMPSSITLAKGVDRACGSFRYFPDKIGRLGGYGVTKYVLPLVAQSNGLSLKSDRRSVLYGFNVLPWLKVEPAINELAFSNDGNTATSNGNTIQPVFTVTANSAWEAISDQTWLTVTPSATGFVLSATTNKSVNQRNATVTVKTGTFILFSIQVTQEGSYEARLDESKFIPIPKSNNFNGNAYSTLDMSVLWDNIVIDGSAWLAYGLVKETVAEPHYLAINLGVKIKLTRFRLWYRTPDFFRSHHPKEIRMYGTNDPTVGNDPESPNSAWILLNPVTFVSVRPSGKDISEWAEEGDQDWVYALQGEQYVFPANVPPVQWIRYVQLSNWGNTVTMYLTELRFWGDDR